MVTKKTKTKAARAKTADNLALVRWEDRASAFTAAQSSLWLAKRALARASGAVREAERNLAAAGLTAHRAGHTEADPWLVWWWNNGVTSPRTGNGWVERATEIPPGVEPIAD